MVSDEQGRLEELRSYDVLDSGPEVAFDDIARLASIVCGTPIAAISLIDVDRQWFKARVGLEVTETPRDVAFCAHAIEQDGLFTVADATLDPRFADNPLVRGDPRIRFYAGAPLVTAAGLPPRPGRRVRSDPPPRRGRGVDGGRPRPLQGGQRHRRP